MSTGDRNGAAAYALLERLRWGTSPPTCPHCGVTGRSHVLRPRGPDRRRTRAGAATERRIWKCGACRRQFSVLVGTILQGTRIDLWIWVDLVRDWSVGRSLPPAGEIGARYGLSSETARQVRARLLAAVDHEPARAVHARMASPAR